MAKILGTVCCVGGALIMALVKGHKLLHTEFLPSIHLTGSEGDDWLLGCLLLLASSVFWSCWMILQVNRNRYIIPDLCFSYFSSYNYV